MGREEVIGGDSDGVRKEKKKTTKSKGREEMRDFIVRKVE